MSLQDTASPVIFMLAAILRHPARELVSPLYQLSREENAQGY
jgi:hypothetical protein